MFPQQTLIITNDVRYMKQAARKDLKTSSRKRSYIRLSDTLENAQSYMSNSSQQMTREKSWC